MPVRTAIALLLLLAACQQQPGASVRPSTLASLQALPSRLATPTASPSPEPPGAIVRFPALDGVLLEGRLLGIDDGGPDRLAIVLAHMGRPGDTQRDLWPLAEHLALEGYTVLTFNRRGICDEASGCSEGQNELRNHWQDLVGAYRWLVEAGYQRVVLGGASIGAMASLEVALREDVDSIGLIWIAGVLNASGYDFEPAELAGLELPVLALSGAGDDGAAESAQTLAELTRNATLVLIESSDHGTDFWRNAPATDGAAAEVAIDAFLADLSSE
jgi:pimeloyl-ACP methyl ester carboxylesterase